MLGMRLTMMMMEMVIKNGPHGGKRLDPRCHPDPTSMHISRRSKLI
jgi:hypothetical protein